VPPFRRPTMREDRDFSRARDLAHLLRPASGVTNRARLPGAADAGLSWAQGL
jgi:hypothetical protein